MGSFIRSNICQMITKTEIRAFIKDKRKQQSRSFICEVSKHITNRIITLETFKEATTVFLYAAFENEIQTQYLHEAATSEGKKVAYPKIESHTAEMSFYEVSNLRELQVNNFKKMEIREPNPRQHIKVIPSQGDVMIVPGLAFDLQGNRVGYGGGFYDRYLQTYQYLYKIGICMDFQVFEKINTEIFDVKVDYILSEKRSYLPF